MLQTGIIWILFLSFLFPLEFVVKPYLQNATPNSIYILWETDSNSDTRVEWGTSTFLGNITSGTALYNSGNSQIHTVQLTDLQPDTRYYYRTVTSTLSSENYDFITPADPSSESSLKIVAMSDMQRDNSNPNKFETGENLFKSIFTLQSNEPNSPSLFY